MLRDSEPLRAPRASIEARVGVRPARGAAALGVALAAAPWRGGEAAASVAAGAGPGGAGPGAAGRGGRVSGCTPRGQLAAADDGRDGLLTAAAAAAEKDDDAIGGGGESLPLCRDGKSRVARACASGVAGGSSGITPWPSPPSHPPASAAWQRAPPPRRR